MKKIPSGGLTLPGISEEYVQPDWTTITAIPVSPLPIRPSISVDGGMMRSEDDPTYNLGETITTSTNLQRCEEEGSPAHCMSEFNNCCRYVVAIRPLHGWDVHLSLDLIQFYVATYTDSDIAGIRQAFYLLTLMKEEGLLCGNLMIGTRRLRDMNQKLDEAGVHGSIAMALTYFSEAS
jgi:DNA-directed RNA polymerase II subunit RPB1